MIKQTQNYEMIKTMLLDDKELFNRISDDYTNTALWDPKKSIWVGYFDNEDCMALLSVHEENSIVLNMHMHIPKKNRGKKSFKIGNSLIDYAIEHCNKRFVKINVKIPVIYQDVIKFAKKVKFEEEGLDKKSFKKNGKIFDRIIMGRVIR